jgi:hypothetical protein
LVVAKAYVDQLERSNGLQAGKIAKVRKAIDSANAGKMKGVAKSLVKDAKASKNVTDMARLNALADVLMQPEM